jgi:hypothetical protein
MNTAVPEAQLRIRLMQVLDAADVKVGVSNLYDTTTPESGHLDVKLAPAVEEASLYEAGNQVTTFTRNIYSHNFALARDARYSRLNRRALLYNGFKERHASLVNALSSSNIMAPVADFPEMIKDLNNAPLTVCLPFRPKADG